MSSYDLATQIQLATKNTPTVPQQKASSNMLAKHFVGTLGSWATAKPHGTKTEKLL